MSLKLRPYQQSIIEKAKSRMIAGVKSILIVAPTGSGKTALTADMLNKSASKDIPSWFLVHRRELILQSTTTFSKFGIRHGIISPSFIEDRRPLVQIGSIPTVVKRHNKLKRPKFIVFDEAHHLGANSWAKIHKEYSDCYIIGLTATPQRLDGRGLKKYFQEMIESPSTLELIEDGFLCPYRLYAPKSADLSKVHIKMGDYVKSELNTIIDKPTITGDAIKHYIKLSNGKRAIVFCVSIEHSKHVVSQFIQSGIPAAHVDGETELKERDSIIKKFNTGEIKVLSNVDLFGEGFDVPLLDTVIMLRPTQSLALYLQMCGRPMRPIYSEGIDLSSKENRLKAILLSNKPYCLILDHAGNCQRHGLPDDERQWSLDGIEKKKSSSSEISVRLCDICFGALRPGIGKCPYCGNQFTTEGRKIDEVDGTLEEIDPALLRKKRLAEQGKARTLEALIELGKRRGYPQYRAWAHKIHSIRQQRGAK